MGMGRRPIKNADETNAYGKARHFYCYLQRPGVVKKIKRNTHKRERHEGRMGIKKGEF